jgi:hypothetical protein
MSVYLEYRAQCPECGAVKMFDSLSGLRAAQQHLFEHGVQVHGLSHAKARTNAKAVGIEEAEP